MLSSPALTTKSSPPSLAIAPCEASDAPAPRPPVWTDPTASSDPSAYRSKTAAAFAVASLVGW
jgi:hypothetical protein